MSAAHVFDAAETHAEAVATSAVVAAHELGRRFGRRTALSGVSLSLHAGRTVGLFGPNGAGKSTLLSILAGHLRPTSGQVTWLRGDRFRGWMGMAPQGAQLPLGDTPRRWLCDLARFQRAAYPAACADEILEAVGLAARGDLRMRSLSEGERRLVAVGQAFLGAPELVLLDEPTAALDPWGRQRMRALVRARRDAGCAILIASHNLGEAEQLCDEALVLVDGKLQPTRPLSALLSAPDEVYIELGAPSATPVPVDALRAAARGVLPELAVTFDAGSRVIKLEGPGVTAQRERLVAAAVGALAGLEVRRVLYGRSLERALTALVTSERIGAAEGRQANEV